MVRPTKFAYVLSWLTLVSAAVACGAEPKSAYDILPQSVQAVVWVPSSDVLVEKWDRTQLSKLASDKAVKEFWEDQRQQIEDRLTAAGWRLHIQPRDLGDIAQGQLALAWMERRDDVLKPFALALIVDVVSKTKDAQEFLTKLDKQLKDRGAKADSLTHQGTSITHYVMPKQNGELLKQETCYALVNEQLIAADDVATLKALIDAAVSTEPAKDKLSSDAVFVAGRQELRPSGDAQVEYFIRPLGFARVIRAISGKRPAGAADILAVLQKQGFEAIRCVTGELQLGSSEYDLKHRGFVLVDEDRPRSVQILDFPNQVTWNVPNWVSADISTYLAASWNAKEAFWKAEDLVDDMLGEKGLFKEVINGIKMDPTGPRIDIQNEVMPLLTNDIFSLSDIKEPIDVDSRRNLIAIRLTKPEAMVKVLEKAMENEPDAEKVTIDGQQMWKVVHKEEEAVDIGFGNDFDTFNKGTPTPAPTQQEPLLSNWAITVYDDYFMFASHIELIENAIAQAKKTKTSPLTPEADYKRIEQALRKAFSDKELCGLQINRSDRSYRSQYELFRAGKLGQSQSMYAHLLDHLLQNKPEIQRSKPVVNGDKLPPFDQIKHYLQPSGMVVNSTAKGWSFGALLLAPEASSTGSVSNSAPNAARAAAETAPTNR